MRKSSFEKIAVVRKPPLFIITYFLRIFKVPGIAAPEAQQHFLLCGRQFSQPAHKKRGSVARGPLRMDTEVHQKGCGMALRTGAQAYTQAHPGRLSLQRTWGTA